MRWTEHVARCKTKKKVYNAEEEHLFVHYENFTLFGGLQQNCEAVFILNIISYLISKSNKSGCISYLAI